MSVTNWSLVLFILVLLAYAVYERLIIPHRNGPVLLSISLLRRSHVDGTIFVSLVVILIYQNMTHHGHLITTWLLCVLALMGLYLFLLRTPQIIFKAQGFFFSGVWIAHSRVKAINLSEDGVLVMQLEQRRLLIRVKNMEDLEKIYNFIIYNK